MKTVEKKVRIGKIRNTHGLKGEVKVIPLTDFPDRFKLLKNVYVEDAHGVYNSFSVTGVRTHKNDILLSLSGIEDVDAAKLLQNCYLAIDKADRMPLEENSYYIDDLIGCSVYEEDIYLGEVSDVVETGANDVYVLKSERWPNLCIPAVQNCIIKVDIMGQRIEVRLPKGLKE